MSQVRNLRAMFENKGDDGGPPDRGRSPSAMAATPTDAANGTESPRPLSKVRTSFVAVEKDGRMGLRRDPSHESSSSRRPLSTDMDNESVSTAAPDDEPKPARRLFVNEPIPESPKTPIQEIPDAPGPTSSMPPKGTDEGLASNEDKGQSLQPSKATNLQSTAKTSQTPNKSIAPKQPEQPALSRTKPARDEITEKPSARKPVTTAKSTTTRNVPASKAGAKPLSQPSAAPPTSSVTRRADTGPTKAQDKLAPKKDVPSSTSSTSTTKKAASSATRKPPALKPSEQPHTGFVKPKPKSPTKPVSLPASLMAPTASSVSKGTSSRQSSSRQSGALQPTAAANRSHGASAPSTLSVNKTLKRQASNISRPRPSVGPPPQKPSQDQKATKRESHVDEDFLSRMMRPTRSSSSKTSERSPSTPPRRTSQRPSTSNTNRSSRRASSTKRSAQLADAEASDTRSSAGSFSTLTTHDPMVESADPVAETKPHNVPHSGVAPDSQEEDAAAVPIETPSVHPVGAQTPRMESTEVLLSSSHKLPVSDENTAQTTTPSQTQPSLEAEQPSLEAEKLSLETQQPSLETEQPSLEIEQPSSETRQTSSDAEQTSTDELTQGTDNAIEATKEADTDTKHVALEVDSQLNSTAQGSGLLEEPVTSAEPTVDSEHSSELAVHVSKDAASTSTYPEALDVGSPTTTSASQEAAKDDEKQGQVSPDPSPRERQSTSPAEEPSLASDAPAKAYSAGEDTTVEPERTPINIGSENEA